MSADELPSDPARQLRLLEGWLPLAQESSARYGWRIDASGLEALVLAAAPSLQRAHSALEARALLWSTYQRLHPEPDK